MKVERFELRVDEAFAAKLEFIKANAAGIRNRSQAVQFAVDVAVQTLSGQGDFETTLIHNRRKTDIKIAG